MCPGRVEDILEACGAFDPGSNPGRGVFDFIFTFKGGFFTKEAVGLAFSLAGTVFPGARTPSRPRAHI